MEVQLQQLQALSQAVGGLDFSRPAANLIGLGVRNGDLAESDTVTFRRPLPQETTLSAPEMEQTFEHILKRVEALRFRNKRNLSTEEFEDLFKSTVDLAELCNDPECNARLDELSIQYDALVESTQVLHHQLNEVQDQFQGDQDHEAIQTLKRRLQQTQKRVHQTRTLAAEKENQLDHLDQLIAEHRGQGPYLPAAGDAGAWNP
ncbi:hypothetical protein IWQ60_000522 [Tieghemiomyces parasiticus]|uniref:Uncharacterized protein n=1 Tax=Tieghemiomyces parasiticus TaxID=78921 RepID=A0A9W8E3D1_9FUNG|nr:hypothetical protein IWQ60_000522 [Tieghemiomyces parasiticus]